MAQPGRHGPAQPPWPSPSGLWQDAGNNGGSPIGVIEEGWAMSVDRLAGSGTAGADTEPARRRGTQRRRAGRKPGTSAGALGVTAPGQAGEVPTGPEPNVTPLGQEAGPGTPAATQVPAAAGAHPAEATPT